MKLIEILIVISQIGGLGIAFAQEAKEDKSSSQASAKETPDAYLDLSDSSTAAICMGDCAVNSQPALAAQTNPGPNNSPSEAARYVQGVVGKKGLVPAESDPNGESN